MIVDNFAGGGGASLGIEMALGRSPDIAINHDPEAIAMHKTNHPRTRHFCEDVFKVDPREACGGRRVGLAWFSPDCKHFSVAKGGKPVEKKIRGLAWVVIRWANTVKPRVILLENVAEFESWGPLLEDGRPDPAKRGITFRRWWGQLEAAGYRVEMRVQRACDYGAPTTRKRLFVIARCDGEPIVWPSPTHGPGTTRPYRTAAECIDWTIPTVSIFATPAEAKPYGAKRPLVPKTMARIGRGIWKFVIDAKEPFIIRHCGGREGDAAPHGLSEPLRTITAAHRGELRLIAPTLVQTGYGERQVQAPRCLDIQRPLGTIVAGGIKHALCAAYLAKYYGDPGRKTGGGIVLGQRAGAPMGTVTVRDHQALVTSHLVKYKGTCRAGQPVDAPMPAIQAGGWHLGEVRAFLVKYYQGGAPGASLHAPMPTATAKDRFGLVTVEGADYCIADIGQRMLVARELFRGQSFPDSYRIDVEYKGKPLSATAQVRMCGNSVSPEHAAALVRANFGERATVAA